MKQFFPIVALVCLAFAYSLGQAPGSATQASPPSQSATPSAAKPQANQEADENANKAKAIIADAIKALGGETYLTIRDREQQGRGYGFHAGRPTGFDCETLSRAQETATESVTPNRRFWRDYVSRGGGVRC